MKLNIDCIKDILTNTEDVTDFVQKFFYESKKVNELFPGYTHDESFTTSTRHLNPD